MSRSRTMKLPRRKQVLKNAFRDLVEAFGGQVAAARHLGSPWRQQRISDLCNTNIDEFAPIDIVQELESNLHGHDGHPHVTRAMAISQDHALMPEYDSENRTLVQHFADVGGETGDVMRSMSRLLDGKPDDLGRDETEIAAQNARQLMEVAAALYTKLSGKDASMEISKNRAGSSGNDTN